MANSIVNNRSSLSMTIVTVSRYQPSFSRAVPVRFGSKICFLLNPLQNVLSSPLPSGAIPSVATQVRDAGGCNANMRNASVAVFALQNPVTQTDKATDGVAPEGKGEAPLPFGGFRREQSTQDDLTGTAQRKVKAESVNCLCPVNCHFCLQCPFTSINQSFSRSRLTSKPSFTAGLACPSKHETKATSLLENSDFSYLKESARDRHLLVKTMDALFFAPANNRVSIGLISWRVEPVKAANKRIFPKSFYRVSFYGEYRI